MSTVLSIICDDLSEESLQELAFEISRTLNRETDLTAKIAEKPGESGNRGDVITLGQIVLTAFTSGAAVALINVLKSYVERNSSVSFEIKTAQGKSFSVNAENLGKDQINQTIQAAKEFCGD